MKANYVTRGNNERKTAKANIRYIQERPGRDKETLTRVLFDSAGILGRREANQFIDAAAKQGRYFYRLKLSPDPKAEDTKRDLHMQKLTRHTMQTLEKQLKTAIPWAGALHDDHSDIRHVHILAAIPRRLQKYELEALIREATILCRKQRRELDLGMVQGRQPDREMHRMPFKRRKPERPNTYDRQLSAKQQEGSHQSSPSCICPSCHFPQEHNRKGSHECVSCGRILHKQREQVLQRKGRGWERSL